MKLYRVTSLVLHKGMTVHSVLRGEQHTTVNFCDYSGEIFATILVETGVEETIANLASAIARTEEKSDV